jgi:O-6-methylguanine DNA methyltransferase
MSPAFKEGVLRIVSAIPEGGVLTYKEVAAAAGKPLAYRAVGNVLRGNWDVKIPCHRVIRSNGTLGGYNRGAKRKRVLLDKEGAI